MKKKHRKTNTNRISSVYIIHTSGEEWFGQLFFLSSFLRDFHSVKIGSFEVLKKNFKINLCQRLVIMLLSR